MNKCLRCGEKTNNPKFCGRSCSASFNNARGQSPKRNLEGACDRCDKSIPTRQKYCRECRIEVDRENRKVNWETATIDEYKGSGNANEGGRYRSIRGASRKSYIESGRPMECFVCGYDVHVDVAHIQAVSSFSGDTLLTVVNSLENLIALCKNHHWEYDNGILSL